MVLTPSGKISRYFYGINYASRDVRLALNEASENQVGTLERSVLLFCFHYDPSSGKYTLAVLNLLKGAAAVTLVLISFFYVRHFCLGRRKPAGGGH